MKTAYEIGDATWIYIRNHEGNLSEGRVVHKFSLRGWAVREFYVVEVPTGIDPLLEVREPESMSGTSAGPIGLWERVRCAAEGRGEQTAARGTFDTPIPIDPPKTEQPR